MENVINNKIGVSFFLKKMSHKDSVKKRGVYATISYSGTSVKMQTGIVCMDPETQWKRGMFEGKNYSNENRKLLEALRDTQTDLQRREDEVREIEQELQAKERRLNDLEDALKSREARVAELESIIAEKDATVRALKDRIAAALTGFIDKGIAVEQRNGKIYVSLEAQLLFPSGSTVVNAEGKGALIDLAKVIKDEQDITILVEGHTDSDPFTGSGVIKDNWDLSVMRATAVVRIMTENGGMAPSMLTAAGRGEFVPVADNSTKEGKAKNRRIEVVLTPNLDQLFEIINE